MVKRSIVVLQFVAIVYLGLLIAGQFGISLKDAQLIDRTKPLWFMNPWRPAQLPTAAEPNADATSREPAFAGAPRQGESLSEAERDYILSPTPALDAVISELESVDVESTESALIPGERVKSAPEVRKKTEKRPTPKKAPAPGPLRITSLGVVPTANGAMLKGFTSAPVSRVELLTTTSPPSMVLELYGQFEQFTGKVFVPPNKIFKAVNTQWSQDKIRIIGVMLTNEAYVAPVTRAESRDEFTVEMTLSSAGQPNFELKGN